MRDPVFIFRIGRLALARLDYPAIGGWRRLWWRVWRRDSRPVVLPEPKSWSQITGDMPPQPKGPMHFCADASGYPLCGATRRERWTPDFAFTTCLDCRALGLPIILHYTVNTR